MAKKLDPIISEFESQEAAESYDRWFREKVRQAMDDPRPGIPHEDVMRQVLAAIDEVVARKRAAGLEEEPAAPFGRLDPIISEFETQEQADSYDAWFREQVQAGIDDPRPRVPHDQVLAEMRGIIDAARARQKKAL